MPPLGEGVVSDGQDAEELARLLADGVPVDGFAALLPTRAESARGTMDGIDGQLDGQPNGRTDGGPNGHGDGFPLHLVDAVRRGMVTEAAETARREARERDEAQRTVIGTLSEVLVARLTELSPDKEFKRTARELKKVGSPNVSRAVIRSGRARVKAKREKIHKRVEHDRERERHTLNYMRNYRAGR